MKIVIGILGLFTIINIIPAAFADIPFDVLIDNEQTVKIEIGGNGVAHVIHEIKHFDDNAKLEFIDGTRSNFDILCLLSCPYEFEDSEQVFEESDYMVFAQYPAFQDDLVIEYDIDDAFINNNGLLTWDFNYGSDTKFYFDESTKLIFIDGMSMDVSLSKGFVCKAMGVCQVKLEFFDTDESLSVTSYDNGISIQSDDEILNYKIINDNSISFDTTAKNSLLWLIFLESITLIFHLKYI